MREKLIVGNWKMNGSLPLNASLLEALVRGWAAPEGRQLAVCVPFPYLAQAREALAGSAVAWGAQDVSEHRPGAYTGEVAASMLKEFGCRFAIVGHSERRQFHGEDDALVGNKAKAALEGGLTPVVCVGETLADRDSGRTEAVVGGQLAVVVGMLGERSSEMVVAYEPVWAIGTGRTATPGQAQEVHASLRRRLVEAGAGDVPLLYGGSVKAASAAALFAMPDVDGGLVGGAALDANEFLAIGLA